MAGIFDLPKQNLSAVLFLYLLFVISYSSVRVWARAPKESVPPNASAPSCSAVALSGRCATARAMAGATQQLFSEDIYMAKLSEQVSRRGRRACVNIKPRVNLRLAVN